MLRRWCRRWGLQDADAEDVAQNILVELSGHVKNYSPSGRFRVLYIALEYVPGSDLGRHIDGRPLLVARAVDLLIPIAQAVQTAHDAGVLHRDLKPANILLSGDTPKVTDFGLARAIDPAGSGPTRTGQILGTPSYMAPEQAAATPGWATVRADVYALGAVLYECLTGAPPFAGETALDTLDRVVRADPVPPRRANPDVPKDLEVICLKCLEKAPGRRYASAATVADDLTRFRDGHPVSARPVGWGQRAGKWAARRPAVTAGLGLGAVAVLALLGLWWNLNSELRAANQQLQEESTNAREQARRAEDTLADAEAIGARILQRVRDDHDLRAAGLEHLRADLTADTLQLYEKLTDRYDDRPDLKRSLQIRTHWLGRLYLQLGRTDRAVEMFDKSIALGEQLIALEPDVPKHRCQTAVGYSDVGRVHSAAGRHDDAVVCWGGPSGHSTPWLT